MQITKLTQTDTVQFANKMSNLPYKEAYSMYTDCLKQYGVDMTVTIVKLAEIYKQTKCGQIQRSEAARLQIEILKEAN